MVTWHGKPLWLYEKPRLAKLALSEIQLSPGLSKDKRLRFKSLTSTRFRPSLRHL